MEFKISEAQARAMACFEEETGCDISVGPDYGIHLDKVMALALHLIYQETLVELLSHQFSHVLSREEVEEVAMSFQVQLQERIMTKIANQKSA
jgi:non-canonical (house-cleaning) NTP pyrophosphatase